MRLSVVGQIRRLISTARMPEREDLEASRPFDDAVVEIVADTTEVQATHTWERDVPGACTDVGLPGEE